MNNSNKYIPWTLLVKDFKDELNETEKQQLDLWLKDSSFSHLYGSLRRCWFFLLGYRVNTQTETDIDRLWRKMEGRISKRKVYLWSVPWKHWGWVASILLAICGISYFLHTDNYEENKQVTPVYTALTGKSKILLPDSSVVWLNKGSTLVYLIEEEGKERRVRLTGEAFFDVYKDPKKSFIVEAKDLEVQVYGTAFTVKDNVNGGTCVSLLRGSVAVRKDSLLRKIEPGEMAVYMPQTDRIETRKVDVEFESLWAKDTLSINKLPLEKVVRYLEKWYDKKILLGESVSKDQAFTFSLTDEPLEEVLRLISRISPVQYQFNDEDIVVINKLNKRRS